jgi:hypothetical protein
MLNRFLHPKSHYYIHFLALSLFVIGIVCSKAFMSMGIFLGLLNLILEADYKGIWINLKKYKVFWLIGILFIFHLLGVLWSTNSTEGIDDLRMKTSLVTVPLIVFAKANDSYYLKVKLIALLLITICFVSIINVLTYFQLFGLREYTDMRQLSLFGSHIRFSLLIAFGLAISLYYFTLSKKIGFLVIGSYLIFYTFLSQVLSGFISVIVVFTVYGIFKLSQNRFKLTAWLVVLSVFLVLISTAIYLAIPPKKNELPVNEAQLIIDWKKASKIDYFGKDKKNQPVASTLIRYMHSKELPADSVGFRQLTSDDIKEIESGTADIYEKTPGLIGKLNEARFQIHCANNPNGSTILQRLEYWKIGLKLIQENFWFGVGTGDIKDEYKKKYQETNSLLLPENRLEAHNTFLTFFITFGIIGFLYFIYFLFFSVREFYKIKDFLGLTFILILTSSFFIEDTLETQMGITIFSFLFSLLFLENKSKEDLEI